MWIGRDTGGGSFANAAFDEFRISNRARSATDISNSYSAGSGISSVAVSVVKSSMAIGNQQSLRATATGPDGRTWDVTRIVRWTSSDATVITVDKDGGVVANRAGSAVISARLANLVSSRTISVSNPGAPIATFTPASVNTFGGKSYDVSVQYTDNTGVLVSSLGSDDLHVTGPNGFSGFMTLLSKSQTVDSKSVSAVYRLVPRGGYWDASDNGVYQISVVPGQIHDIQGRTNGHRVVATFQVAVAPEILTPSPTTDTRRPIFQWSPVSGAVGYGVRIYNLDSGKSEVLSTRVSAPRYLPATPLAVGNYEVQVRSEHPSGFVSEWSTARTFQIINQHLGTTESDAFVLSFASGTVKITQASGVGTPVNKGTFPLTVPIKLKGLTSADSVKVVGTNGNDVISLSSIGLTVNGVQIIVDGSAPITLAGAAGNDAYRFDADSALGSFTLDESGGGIDTLDFSMTSAAGVVVNLGNSALQKVHPDNLSLKLSAVTSFENVVGGSGNDSLTGNGSGNSITGGGGHDTLNGAGGNDSLIGGSGDDVYVFNTALTSESDTVTELPNSGTDTLNFVALSSAVTINLGTLSVQPVHNNRTLKLNSVAVIENVTGGSAGDVLIGNSLANVLVGNNGGDQLSGGDGRDILIGGAGVDRINGGAEEDILIAGRTALDQMYSRLIDVSNAWRSTDSYATRLTNIRAGVGPSMTSLKAKINVLSDVAQPDSLTGGIGKDWYFRAVDDVLSDLVTGESIDLL